MEIKDVFITATSSFFPNRAVGNEEMERYLGMIGEKPSRVKNVILRQNGIKTRYYALDANQNITHTNAELAKQSIVRLFNSEEEMLGIEVLTCGTSTPDQLLPSHASMVHGETFKHPLEIFSLAGVCLTGMVALKTAYLSIMSGNSYNAVCSTSELVSPVLLSKFFNEELKSKERIENNPVIAFEKDFLRYMLSDGAASVLLQNECADGGGLKIEWINTISYANCKPACMYMWADVNTEGRLVSWKDFTGNEIQEQSVWCIKQNVKLLNEFIVPYFVDAIEKSVKEHNVDAEKVRYVIPHISSMYFYNKLAEEITKRGINLPTDKWFTNLTWVGNVGSVAIFAALNELLRTKPLNKGDQILLLVPESGRFSYGIALLTAN
ncbi:StlD/DarB family beta-ketosynthase [Bacteroides sp.]|jgi:putative 3-oxoacyl-(acyl carrier protein) synthase III|uniref:StlD/DarB family beta-ketosynthase n=1 Tax=Bacteroides sp. TaxID=29523 RepID=UPI00263350D3|nr:StlD/DarB family beta-ketosynthase [Bacteroides sp.]MDD3038057.1 StlD/DarB family beta-ketosynthase [Bacteroides sp.]